MTQIAEQNVNFGPTLNGENQIVNPNVENSSRTIKRRKLCSNVWNEFTKIIEDGKEWAVCNHCKKKFPGSSKIGTRHLRNHIDRCPSKRNAGGGTDRSADQTGTCLTTTSANISGKSKVDEELNRLDETRMIMKYWVPLESVKDDILQVFKVFKEEKEKLRTYFDKLTCRFSLSIKYLDSNPRCQVYASVVFIDDNWELKKKLIYFEIGDDRSFCELPKCMLKDWNIEKRMCSMVDDDLGDDTEWIDEGGSLPLAGRFFPVHRLIDPLETARWRSRPLYDSICSKLSGLQAYVSKMPSDGNNKFEIAVDEAAKSVGIKLTSQPLPLTGLSSFELFAWGVGLKQAFWVLEQMDDAFKPLNLTKDQWDDATAIYKFWKELIDMVKSFPDCKRTTSNVYFPKICELYMTLLRRERSEIDSVRQMASTVRKSIFDVYWTDLSLVLAISVIFDPRFKLDIVKGWYQEIYGCDSNMHIEEIIEEVSDIYNKYPKASGSSKTPTMLDSLGRPRIQSELDRYLEERKISPVEDFDILAWWSSNSQDYPTLARMARDYLAIPIGVENCLDSSLLNEILSIIRCEGLDDNIKEALVYSKAWL